MSNYKTIALTGAETEVKISGQNCDIRNDGTDTVYAGGRAGVVAGADGVASIPAGQAVKLLDTNGTVYLLGTGSVLLCGNDYAEPVFKAAASASGGGGTEDTVARNAINTHAANGEIHLTAEKAVEAAATAISNPNLLINSWFGKGVINQRGANAAIDSYCYDCWYGKYTVTSNGIEFTAQEQYAVQTLENAERLINKNVTATVYYDDGTFECGTTIIGGESSNYFITSDRVHCLFNPVNGENKLMIWSVAACSVIAVKLELGSVATPFVPPNPATELAKCQRYFYSTYQGVPAGTPASYANELVLNATSANRFNHTMIDFPTTMRTTPTVRFFDPVTGEEGYACKSGTDEKAPVNVLIAGQNRAAIDSSGLTVGMDYYLHYTASAEL